jgi:hypothetical protein
MVKKVVDVQIMKLNSDGKVVKNYGIHDGTRDGKDVALKYYTSELGPGETFLCKDVDRIQVTFSDLTEVQRQQIQKDRYLKSL